jgi:hypothetical protein
MYFSVNETHFYIGDDGTKKIPSQFFRRVLADFAGELFLDWK